jgi:hypothetical protein
MTNFECRIMKYKKTEFSKLSEPLYDEGQGPSVDLTREPWVQPVRRWGVRGEKSISPR